MKNYSKIFADTRKFLLKNNIIFSIFICFLFPLFIGSKFAYYDFYFFIQIVLLFYFLLRFQFIKINFCFSLLTVTFFLIYLYRIYRNMEGQIPNFSQTDISLFVFCFLCSIIDFDKLRKKERKILQSAHKPFFIKDDKNVIISEKLLIKLFLFFIFAFILAATLEPMGVSNSTVTNSRYRINFSDPNFSAFVGMFLFYILSFQFPRYFFLISGLAIVLLTGSRAGLLLFLSFYILLLFPKYSWHRLFFLFTLILCSIYVLSWFVFDYAGTSNPSGLIITSFLNQFCPVVNCRPLQAFIETGPLRILDIFDVSNFHRFNVIGANLHDLSKINILEYALPMPDFNGVNRSFYSSHELFLSLLPRTGLFLSVYFYFLSFFLIKSSYFFRILMFPILLASIFLGSQFLLLVPLIFLSFFYFYSVEKGS
jgi:hypothetical protein